MMCAQLELAELAYQVLRAMGSPQVGLEVGSGQVELSRALAVAASPGLCAILLRL